MPARIDRQNHEGHFRCGGCGQYKSRSEFWASKDRSDRLQSQCKDCSRRRNREKSYPRMRTTKKYKQQHCIRSKRTRERYPERTRARQMVKGRGLKKDACEHCGATEKLELHHSDYSKPLEVVTLCIPCHRIADKERQASEQST